MMMKLTRANVIRHAIAATLFSLVLGPLTTPAQPQSGREAPGLSGIWYDDTGKGAVEITPCGDRLCGRIVWLRPETDKAGRPLTDGLNSDPARRSRPICGLEILGDVKQQADGSWDQGWIYDPKEGKSYDVELKLRGPSQLQVTGYLGVKFLSETMLWKRAPADLKRCNGLSTAQVR